MDRAQVEKGDEITGKIRDKGEFGDYFIDYRGLIVFVKETPTGIDLKGRVIRATITHIAKTSAFAIFEDFA